MSGQRRSDGATGRRRVHEPSGRAARRKLRRQTQNSQSRRSFTLLELLVVVLLLGIVATGVALRLDSTTDRARLRAATVKIEQALRLARHRARTSRQSAWLVFEPGSAHYRLAFDDEPGVLHALDGVTVVKAAVGAARAAAPNGQNFAVRVTPTGATLPWALELRAAELRRVVWTDGVTGRLAFSDGIGLDEFAWDAALRGTTP